MLPILFVVFNSTDVSIKSIGNSNFNTHYLEQWNTKYDSINLFISQNTHSLVDQEIKKKWKEKILIFGEVVWKRCMKEMW